MTRFSKSTLALAALAGALCVNIRISHAYQTGDSRWCAVTNKGADTMSSDCEYESSDECEGHSLAVAVMRHKSVLANAWYAARIQLLC
jgi:hypothetical protein